MDTDFSENNFVVCINNVDCEDLQLRKIYEILPDERAAQDDYLRVIDESGEDYLYPASYFCPVLLPRTAKEIVRIAA